MTALSCGISRAETAIAPPRPLYSFNQSPLIQIYGLPALGASRVLGQGESALAVHLQIANHFTGTSTSSETLSLDGETRRLTLHWRQGLPGNREWGIELPYVSHNGGFLDMSIEEFHDILGLPQNGRTDLPRNRIDFRYARQGVNLVNLDRAVSGVGDVRLSAAIPLAAEPASGAYTAAWRMSLKLPTGDADELLGSGSTDLAGWLSAATTRAPDKWNLYGGGGLLMMSEGDVIPSQQRGLVAFGTLGLSQRFFPAVTVNAQLDFHSPFYSDSGLRQLGRYAAQGLLGLDWEFAPRKFLAFSISEDMVVGAAPDVAFNLSLAMPL
ncbi:MAG: DUF3187 family protein [Pseudomonadota bacterium]